MNTLYDDFVYPNRCHPQTHPDRLAVIGELFGLRTARPDRCRVLELGCGNGSNLLPLAFAFPDCRFVGIDLAQTLIDAARQASGDLGLSNIEFHQGDLCRYPLTGEPFDFIIAHGVYSWVPPGVREALLAICRARLARNGVAFVSYNCLPGCHIRRMVREIMRFHTRSVTDPREQVAQATAVCQFIANSIDKPDTYRSVFKEQLLQVQRYGSGHLFHDDLAEVNDPVYFHEFAAHAARHGLQFLGESDFFEMQDQAFTPEARAALGAVKDSRLTREQYLDFIKGRRFRQTILCHHEVSLLDEPVSGAIHDFEIGSDAKPVGECQLGEGVVVRFEESRGGAIEIDYPVAKAALLELGQVWPSTISFEQLLRLSAKRLPQQIAFNESEARHKLSLILLEAYRMGLIDFRFTPIRCQHLRSPTPAVWPFARWQAGRGPVVTTLRGDSLRVEDEEGRRLLSLLDGTRSLGELREAMSGAEVVDGPADSRLERRLDELAKFALLEH